MRSAAILPLSAIDPVLSSASATRIFTLPHAVVEVLLKGMVGKPATFMKSVLIYADPLTWTVEPMLPALAV